MTVAKTSSAERGSLNLSIARGTRLRSVNDAYSDVAVESVAGRSLGGSAIDDIGKGKIIVSSAKPVKYLLFVYSTDMNKESAPASARYELDKKDYALAAIMHEADLTHELVRVIQAAVWIYTNNITYESFPVQGFPLSMWYRALAVVSAYKENPSEPKVARIFIGKPTPGKRALKISIYLSTFAFWRVFRTQAPSNAVAPPTTDDFIDKELDRISKQGGNSPLPQASETPLEADGWEGVVVKNDTPYALKLFYSAL